MAKVNKAAEFDFVKRFSRAKKKKATIMTE